MFRQHLIILYIVELTLKQKNMKQIWSTISSWIAFQKSQYVDKLKKRVALSNHTELTIILEFHWNSVKKNITRRVDKPIVYNYSNFLDQ